MCNDEKPNANPWIAIDSSSQAKSELTVDRSKVVWNPLKAVRLNDWESTYKLHSGEWGLGVRTAVCDIVNDQIACN